MTGLGYLAPGFNYSAAYAASANGSVIVGVGEPNGGGYEAFRWTAATGMVGVGSLGSVGNGAQSYAYSVSADGRVVTGTSSGALGTQVFQWSAATGIVGLPGYISNSNSPVKASSDGTVVVGTNAKKQAFMFTAPNSMMSLGCGGGFSCTANAVSGDGKVVVGRVLIARARDEP
jgi:probable HAF family extracellular repeat protein